LLLVDGLSYVKYTYSSNHFVRGNIGIGLTVVEKHTFRHAVGTGSVEWAVHRG